MLSYNETEINGTALGIDKKFWEYFDDVTNATPLYNYSDEVVSKDQGPILATYGFLLAVGGIGNVAVLIALTKSKRRKTRVDLLMTHLAVADVCVTCGVIPLEIGWKYTNAWLAGNFLCKLLLVLRAFGLYLSSNVLICLSIDRFFAVIYPLRLPDARKRSRQMLVGAWVTALACSLPQSVVFRVLQHPRVPGFEQCVSFDAFRTQQQEVIYNVFCMSAMYFLPLVVITVCYVCIFCEIKRSSKEFDVRCVPKSEDENHVNLRRSDKTVLERARRRTLRMTVVIVSVFALCWLPYATMAMWYMADRKSAEQVSRRVQDLLFAMAVSNSCMNPLVYGSYTMDLWGNLYRFLRKILCCCFSTTPGYNGNSISSPVKNKRVHFETPLIKTSNVTRRCPRLEACLAETTFAVQQQLEVSGHRRSTA